MAKVVFASNNKGKCIEVQHILAKADLQLVPQAEFNVPEVAETGLTFVENALIKARHASLQTGMPALADDSGLVVDVLGGQPGIYSARYAGEHASADENNKKLLSVLQDYPAIEQRGAHFVSVLVYLQHAEDPMPILSIGKWHGAIALQAAGTEGHGYDPVFYLLDRQCTAAEISLEEKNPISHRAQALHLLQIEM